MPPSDIKQERQDRLASLIFQRGSMKVDELLRLMDVSAVTLYRDLGDLENRRVIVRGRGEVSAAATSLSETSFEFRLTQEVATKQALAAAVDPLVPRGASLFVDDSTTAWFVLDRVLGTRPLTLLTNCHAQAGRAMHAAHTDVIMLGGRFVPQLEACYGPAALAHLARTHVDVAIMGAAALNQGRVLHPYEDVADFKRAVVRSAKSKILVVTASKLSRSALHDVCPLSDFDVVVTNADANDQQLKGATKDGLTVIRP